MNGGQGMIGTAPDLGVECCIDDNSHIISVQSLSKYDLAPHENCLHEAVFMRGQIIFFMKKQKCYRRIIVTKIFLRSSVLEVKIGLVEKNSSRKLLLEKCDQYKYLEITDIS